MRLKISIEEILAALILISCLNGTYISVCIPAFNYYMFFIRIVLIIFIVVKNILGKKRYSDIMKYIILFFGWMLFVTIVKKQGVFNFFYSISIPYLMTCYLDSRRQSAKIRKIFCVWRNILFVLLISDIISMVLYPNGLYSTAEYTNNWFLGYKTIRLTYILPLCIFQTIIGTRKKGSTILVCLLSIFDLAFSKATAASVGLSIVCFTIIVMKVSEKLRFGHVQMGEEIRKSISRISTHYRIIFVVVIIGVVAILNSNRYGAVQYVVENVLKKDSTFTSRTILWGKTLNLIYNAPLTGYGYISAASYQELFNNMFYTSPHNFVLSLLLNGGVIGTMIYLTIMVKFFRQAYRVKTTSAIVSCLGIICCFIVGMTSSTMLYTLGDFLLFIIPFCKNISSDTLICTSEQPTERIKLR